MSATDRPKNRLAGSASPYLEQHAHNPVDWYPWGEDALARAVKEDRPILLSIGYSACHWCHVMERESFEDQATAALMNERFVNVKVDREERPDLDHIYQLVVQLLGRSGGWPLTVFLTPTQRPFFGGTYFPPVDRHGMPSFTKILTLVSDAYRERRGDVDLQAGEVSAAIAKVAAGDAGGKTATLSPEALGRATDALGERFDDEHGGFGGRPKFPNTMPLELLLRRGARDGDARALARVSRALEAMQDGGVFDQLGGGFHRYSTDEKWLVPHFEKMLYDNALLLRLYVEAFRATGDERFAATASAVAGYVTRDMVAPGGGFAASEDADAEGEEGLSFVWDRADLEAALGGDAALVDLVSARFGVTTKGNFEDTGKSVLFRSQTAESLAIKRGQAPSATLAELERARVALLAARGRRPRPLRDDKVLASWNALMIGALAEASQALGRADLLIAATEAFAFVERTLVTGSRVARFTRNGVVRGPGFLEDQAFVASAALDLYEATGEPRYVTLAEALTTTLLARFADDGGGGFFLSADDGERILERPKSAHDQSVPSGASIACLVLLRLGALAGEPYASRAERELTRVAPAALDNPFGYSQSLLAMDRLVRGSVDVVLVGGRDDPATRALAKVVHAAYLPGRTLAWLDRGDPASVHACRELAEGKEARSAPVAYVCRGRTCSLPATSPEALARELSPK